MTAEGGIRPRRGVNAIQQRQAQQLVVALHIAGKVLEPITCTVWPGVALAPVLRLAQLEALDHGAHGTVDDKDAFGQQCV